MTLRRPFRLGILEKPTPFPGMYCEWVEGVGGQREWGPRLSAIPPPGH